MVSMTIWIFSGPFMNLFRAFLSLMVAANLYVIISSGVIQLNSHFLLMSTSFIVFLSDIKELGSNVEYISRGYECLLEQFQ